MLRPVNGYLEINPLGNVFDPDFQLLTVGRQCRESWCCPACDRDKVTVNASRPADLSIQ